MRISDWSSDVCSSDLCAGRPPRTGRLAVPGAGGTDRQKRTSLKKPKPHGRTNSDRVDMPDGAGRTPVPQSATIQSSKPPPKERFAWLDLLRGVATILVLVLHSKLIGELHGITPDFTLVHINKIGRASCRERVCHNV